MVDTLSFVNDGLSTEYFLEKKFFSKKKINRIYVVSQVQCASVVTYRFFIDNSIFFDFKTNDGQANNELLKNANQPCSTIKISAYLAGLPVPNAQFLCIIEYEDVV